MRKRFRWSSTEEYIEKNIDGKIYKIKVGDKILFKKNYKQEVVHGVTSGPFKNNSSDWVTDIEGDIIRLLSGKTVYMKKHVGLIDVTIGYFTTVDSSMGSEYSHCLFYVPMKLRSLVGFFDRYKLLVALSRSKVMNIVVGHTICVPHREMSAWFRRFSESASIDRENISIDIIYLLELIYQDKGKDPNSTLLKALLQ